MDLKETASLIQAQEQVINLLIRVSALEKVLQDAGVLDVEKYNAQINNNVSLVSDKLKEAYKDIDKLKAALASVDNTEKTTSEETKE